MEYTGILEQQEMKHSGSIQVIAPEDGFRTWMCKVQYTDAKWIIREVTGFGLDARDCYERAIELVAKEQEYYGSIKLND